MIWIDTNLLIRIITNDVPELHDRAIAMLAKHEQADLTVPDIVMTELFFVLEHSPLYHYTRAEVCRAVRELLENAPLTVSDAAMPALNLAAKNPELDFTDCLLAVYAGRRSSRLLTFDKHMLRELG